VYAVNGPNIPLSSSGEFEELQDGVSDPKEGMSDESTQRARDGNTPTAWAEETINGLCVSRNGHLFATMTESSIAIWQTKVIGPHSL
jgi:hypothetical protein